MRTRLITAVVFFLGLICTFTEFCFADASAKGVKITPGVQEAFELIRRSYGTGGLAKMMRERKLLRDSGKLNKHNQLQLVNTVKLPVILGNYSDRTNTYTASTFQDLLFGSNPTGNMIQYYSEVSYGQFTLTGATYGWFSVPETQTFYVSDGDYGLEGGGARFVRGSSGASRCNS